MSERLIRRVFQAKLQAWARARSPVMRVAWENTTFEPFPNETYLRAYLLPATTLNLALDGSHRRYAGIYQVDIVASPNTGWGEAAALADDLEPIFDTTQPMRLAGFHVFITQPFSPAVGRQEPTRFVLSCSVGYVANVFRGVPVLIEITSANSPYPQLIPQGQRAVVTVGSGGLASVRRLMDGVEVDNTIVASGTDFTFGEYFKDMTIEVSAVQGTVYLEVQQSADPVRSNNRGFRLGERTWLGEVANQGAMLSLVAFRGDFCARTDQLGAIWECIGSPATQVENWREYVAKAAVPLVTTAVDGLMLKTDKAKLDAIEEEATKNAADADLLERENHTGTQLAETIADFHDAVRTNRLDQLADPAADLDMGGYKLTNLAPGASSNDAATVGQLTDTINGFFWKVEVYVATTANIALTGAQTVDGLSVTNQRVLVKDQTNKAENGLYQAAAGAWTRTTDADTGAELVAATVLVPNGSDGNKGNWRQNTPGPITLGTTELVWGRINQGTSISQGTGIVVAGPTIAIDTAVVPRKTAPTLFGDGIAETFNFAHNLNTFGITAEVYDQATKESVEFYLRRLTVNTAEIVVAGGAPTADQYAVVFYG